jgi:hypothetical protein
VRLAVNPHTRRLHANKHTPRPYLLTFGGGAR